VNPTPNDPATVLDGLDYSQLSTFMPATRDNPDGTWVTYYRDVPEGVNDMLPMHGQHGYMLKMNASGTLRVMGTPAMGSRRFSGGSSQLFGVTL